MMARVCLFAFVTGLLWTGLGFAGFAIFAFIARTLSPDAAAALTSLIVFASVGLATAISIAGNQKPAPPPASLLNGGLAARLQQLAPELAPEMAGFASRHPLFAIGIAAALGLAATSASHERGQDQTPKFTP